MVRFRKPAEEVPVQPAIQADKSLNIKVLSLEEAAHDPRPVEKAVG
jgi:hypothetical protein